MDEILGTRINIKFCKSKLELEMKRNAQWIPIKYKTYMCVRHNLLLSIIKSIIYLKCSVLVSKI